jgi:hypothetical protein
MKKSGRKKGSLSQKNFFNDGTLKFEISLVIFRNISNKETLDLKVSFSHRISTA